MEQVDKDASYLNCVKLCSVRYMLLLFYIVIGNYSYSIFPFAVSVHNNVFCNFMYVCMIS